MIYRLAKIIGVIAIIAFSAYSCFLAFYIREIDPNSRNAELSKRYVAFFEERFSDIRAKLAHKQKEEKDKRIILAAIDDESLNKIGRWPWSRSKMAELVNKLNIYGAKVITFDVIFSEPEILRTIAFIYEFALP